MGRKLLFRGTIALLLVLYLYLFSWIQRHSIKPSFEDFLADFTNDSKNASPLVAKNAQENERLVNLRKNSVVFNRTGNFLSIRDGNLNESVRSHERLEQNNKQPPQTLGKFTNDLSQLPEWMTEYFDWHKATKKNLNETNWNSTKHIVMFCIRKHKACGGISDRLKPLPFVVLEAARYKRLLLIWWEKPKPLEEFLLPPEGGVDWRVPDWFKKNIRKNSRFKLGGGANDVENRLKSRPNEPIVLLKIQTPSAGEDFYGEHPFAKSTYQDVFHGLFRHFFTPAPRLASLIDSKMKEHNLVPGEYAATHLRSMYGNREWRDPQETITLTVNGINCASTLFPGAPVYFAADIKFAVEVAREYGRQHSLPIGSLDFNDDPIHLDKDENWYKRKASTYDDTFVDLYMLGQSRCVAYSNGGYGTFGSLLSYNASCNTRFFKGRKTGFSDCKWTYADGSIKRLRRPKVSIPPDLLVNRSR